MEVRNDNSEIKKNAQKQLFAYVYSGIRKINVISPINNKESIFKDALKWAYDLKKSIIYISNEKTNNNKILGELIKKSNKVNICTFNEALYSNEKYDLVIYNEILGKPIYKKEIIADTLNKLCDDYGSIIAYSFEHIFDNEVNVYNFDWNRKTPVMEPRIVTTRINLEEDLPLNVYDYINWAINTNKKVLIYVPDHEKVEKVWQVLDKVNTKLKTKLFKSSSYDNDELVISKFKISSSGILITDNLHFEFKGICKTDVILFFADSDNLNYKDLLYISSQGDELSQSGCDEVIFVCKNETFAMDKCKSILRGLNKKAWEQGLYII